MQEVKIVQSGRDFKAHNTKGMFGPPKESLDTLMLDLNRLSPRQPNEHLFYLLGFLLLAIPPIGVAILVYLYLRLQK